MSGGAACGGDNNYDDRSVVFCGGSRKGCGCSRNKGCGCGAGGGGGDTTTATEDVGSLGKSTEATVGTTESSAGKHNASRTNNNNNHSSREVEEEEQEELAKRETAQVFYLRLVVLLVLALAAATVCVAVHFIARRGEREEFVSTYAGSAQKVLDSFEQIVGQKVAAVASFGVTLTAYARRNNESWPFVTMNDFQQQAASTRSLSGVLFIQLQPIVTSEQRQKWETYSVNQSAWIKEGRAYQDEYTSAPPMDGGVAIETYREFVGAYDTPSPKIFKIDNTWSPIAENGPGPYYPIWTSSPVLPPPRELMNLNMHSAPGHGVFFDKTTETGEISIGGITVVPAGGIDSTVASTNFHAFIMSIAAGKIVEYAGDPMSNLFVPVFDRYDQDRRKVVGIIKSTVHWSSYFVGVLPYNSPPVRMILENDCEDPPQQHSYDVGGGDDVVYVGEGDIHDAAYDSLKMCAHFEDWVDLKDGRQFGFKINQDICSYSLRVYPTKTLENAHRSARPVVITFVVGLVFVFSIIMFFVYDRLVERRQRLVMKTAQRTTAIVSSLFPRQIRDRLFAAEEEEALAAKQAGAKTRLKSFMSSSGHLIRTGVDDSSTPPDLGTTDLMFKTKPIADLFTDTSILFGDIAGFTAWSSVREPSQVFMLLETVYRAFDLIAQRRSVFKVETVGDCYVAATGLPDPRRDHVVALCRFARDCMIKFNLLTKNLEVALGPDTGDLGMRFGIHSGPVTAGVLRGQRSRFQLFGDAMNTAARMESTGLMGRIQLSQETADLLVAAGKSEWITPRETKIVAKGKGEMQTYWLSLKPDESVDTMTQSDGSDPEADILLNLRASQREENAQQRTKPRGVSSDKLARLIEWNVAALARLLKQIVARRNAMTAAESYHPGFNFSASFDEKHVPHGHLSDKGNRTIDEVKEIIKLPKYSGGRALKQEDPESIVLNQAVVEQLHRYVRDIAAMYRDNPFHNFEHASHVSMSVNKLLSRIVAPSEMEYEENIAKISKTLHDHTYGITSDPLTQFACVFSALIHDADHTGVPNATLVKEKVPIATYYKNQSVAEQNSVDLAWKMLQKESFADLRQTIYRSEGEYKRFRSLVVNSVMATDIVDKELIALRNARWTKAFTEQPGEATPRDAVNRKATIVIEHLIQASDVSHTMQHWHIYRKWNERFFMECYKAFVDGHAEMGPAAGWYKGEIDFFDFYIIPLAKKLKDCGVFGVSSDEYLSYAEKNRQEWELRGKEVVEEMVIKAREQFGVAKGFRRGRSLEEVVIFCDEQSSDDTMQLVRRFSGGGSETETSASCEGCKGVNSALDKEYGDETEGSADMSVCL